jgi:hypothetical protein
MASRENRERRVSQIQSIDDQIDGFIKVLTQTKRTITSVIKPEINSVNTERETFTNALDKTVNNFKNNSFNSIETYINTQFAKGLGSIENFKTINNKYDVIQSEIDRCREIIEPQNKLFTNINQSIFTNNNGTKNDESVLKVTTYNRLYSEMETLFDGIVSIATIKETFLDNFKSYLTQLRIDISTSVVNFYQTYSNNKIVVIDGLIDSVNGLNNSKQSYNLIMKDNDGIIAQIVLLKAVLAKLNSQLGKNIVGQNNYIKNGFKENISGLLTTLSENYTELLSREKPRIIEKYSTKVEGNITKLNNQLKTKKAEFKTILTQLSTNFLQTHLTANQYNLKSITERLMLDVDGFVIQSTSEGIKTKLEEIILAINTRLSGEGLPGANALMLVRGNAAGNGAPAQANAKGPNSSKVRPANEQLNGTGNYRPILGNLNNNANAPNGVQATPVNSPIGRKVTVPPTEYGKPRRNGVIASTAYNNGRLGVKIGNSQVITPFKINQIEFLANVAPKNNANAPNASQARARVNAVAPANVSQARAQVNTVAPANATTQANENEYQKALATSNNLALISRALKKFPNSQTKFTRNQKNRYNALEAHQSKLLAK